MKKVIITPAYVNCIPHSPAGNMIYYNLDRRANEIGIAGASCTSYCSGIGSIIPGNGTIIVQAISNYNAHDMPEKP